MTKTTRRAFLTAAGLTGAVAAATAAQHYGLIPPDPGGAYGIGEVLNYATHRLTSHAMAREFPESEISQVPFANETARPGDEFQRLEAVRFAGWHLSIDGLVDRPQSLSLAEVKTLPAHSHVTHLACEEGWSYIARWTGVQVSHLLEKAGVRPQAKYLVYFSIEKDWWDSIDLDEAAHPQTLIAWGLNNADLPAGNGGPLRMRVPRQLGYKNVKFITRLTLTDDLKKFGKGLGSASPEGGYAWYAGI